MLWYIYLLYLKRHFLMQNFFTSILIVASSKRRSSSSEVFYKIGVLKSFTKFTEKYLCRSLFLEACNFIKTKNLTQIFFVCFCKIFKNIYFVGHLRTAASEKGSINSNNTVRSLSKIWFFLYSRPGFLVTLNICSKKKI